MTIEPAQYCDAGIPGGDFPSDNACRAAWRMNQARNRTAGNKLFMRIASNHYVKMAAPGWPFSCNTGIKVTSARASQPGSCDQALTVSCIVTQFGRESFGIGRFRGSCMVYEKIRLRACLHGGWGPQVGKVTCGGSPHLSCKRDPIKTRQAGYPA